MFSEGRQPWIITRQRVTIDADLSYSSCCLIPIFMRKLLFLLAFLLPSVSSSQNWQSLDGPYGQIVTGIAISENNTIHTSSFLEGLFARKAGGSWSSEYSDGTSAWTFVKAIGTNTIIAGRPSVVVRSADDGKTWNVVLAGEKSGGGMYPALTQLRDTLYLLLTDDSPSNYNGLFISDNGGETWLRRMREIGYASSGLASDSTGRMAAASYSDVYWSDDHFSTQERAFPRKSIRFTVIESDSVGEVWLAATFDEGLFYSRDRKMWSAPKGAVLPDTVWTVAITPRGIAFAGSNEGAYTSTDGGSTWSTFNEGLPPGFAATFLYVAPDGHLYVGTNGAGIFRTEKPVTAAYAVLPPQASVQREHKAEGMIIDGERIVIPAEVGAELSFRDLLGRAISIPFVRVDQGFAIERAALGGQMIFGLLKMGGQTRTIKLIAE